MAFRSAQVRWTGSLMGGSGHLRLASGVIDHEVTMEDRVSETRNTNPEELIAGAQAQCYAMVLAKLMGDAGFVPDRIEVSAHVNLTKSKAGFTIDRITVEAEVFAAGMDEGIFERQVQRAQDECPVSRALATVEHVYRHHLNPSR